MPPDDQYLSTPSEVDLKLRLGICQLLERKYRPIMGNRSKFLSAGLVNWALCDVPENEEAKQFVETNQILIEQEAGNLYRNQTISCALSTLYTFTLIWLGPTNPEKSLKIVERASQLNIMIFSAKDLCPTQDAAEFLTFLDRFADGILQK